VDKGECIYASPTIYIPGYRHAGMELRSHRDPIYEVPDRGRMKLEVQDHGGNLEMVNFKCRKVINLINYYHLRDSSSESDNEDLLYTLHSPDDRIIRDEARESETECDRLWKTFEANQYEGNKRWAADHAVLA
ncbi:uncharacterized protein CDAR_366291, partial [Caerostris darwini]